jgi:hypothetical protein
MPKVQLDWPRISLEFAHVQTTPVPEIIEQGSDTRRGMDQTEYWENTENDRQNGPSEPVYVR